MSNPHHRLQHQSGQEQAATGQQSAARTDLEFNTAEEAIRHDAAATELPPALAERLRKSIEQEPPPPKPSWWKRLFGR